MPKRRNREKAEPKGKAKRRTRAKVETVPPSVVPPDAPTAKHYSPMELAAMHEPHLFGRDHIAGFAYGNEERSAAQSLPFYLEGNALVTLGRPRIDALLGKTATVHATNNITARPPFAQTSKTMLANYVPCTTVRIDMGGKEVLLRCDANAGLSGMLVKIPSKHIQKRQVDNMINNFHIPKHPQMLSNWQLVETDGGRRMVLNFKLGETEQSQITGKYVRLFAQDTKCTVKDLQEGSVLTYLMNTTQPLVGPNLPQKYLETDHYRFMLSNADMTGEHSLYPIERSLKQREMQWSAPNRTQLPWWLGKKPNQQ